MDYFVYLHIAPSGKLNDIFYVGYGNEKRTRLKRRIHNSYHINIHDFYGSKNIIVKKIKCENVEHAKKLESIIIEKLISMGVFLCNNESFKYDDGEYQEGLLNFHKKYAKIDRTTIKIIQKLKNTIQDLENNLKINKTENKLYFKIFKKYPSYTY
jgi:hypothetical protein